MSGWITGSTPAPQYLYSYNMSPVESILCKHAHMLFLKVFATTRLEFIATILSWYSLALFLASATSRSRLSYEISRLETCTDLHTRANYGYNRDYNMRAPWH